MRYLPKAGLLFAALVMTSLFFGFFKSVVHAQSTVCSASTNPTSIAANTEADLEITVNNSSPVVEGASTSVLGLYDATIEWIRITAPSGTTIVQDVSDGDWAGATEGGSVTLEGGTLSAGSSVSFVLTVQTGANLVYSDQWTVEASIEPGGGGTIATCGIGAVSRLPVISGISLNISSTGASISWTTDVAADSTVEYGTTTSYGSSKYDGTSTTSHSLSIGGLNASTTYYYKVKSTSSGGTGEVGGNSFTTGAAGTSTTTTTTGTTTTTTATTTATPKDTTPPSIMISTDFSEPFEQAPTIEGKATDPSKIIKVEYSTDGGVNWLPAEADNLGEKTVDFEFTPELFEDGSYEIIVRALDVEDNEGKSKVNILVIDRLPPLVGGGLFAIGPQILFPDSGSIVTLAGIDTSVVFASSGGATSIKIVSDDYDFGLSKNSENGLWYGNLNFKDPGTYDLTARSIDGAENETERAVGRVVVLAPGKVLPEDGGSIPQSKVLVYVKDPILGTFSLWDSSAWGQENPQNLKEGGNYRLVLPPGTYYLQVQAHGYKALKTNIFSLEKTTPIVSTLTLSKKKTIKIGPFEIPLFDFGQTSGQINTDYEIPKVRDLLVGKELPNFQIEGLERKIDSTSFNGRATLISILSTWHPQSSAQIKILGELGEELEANIIVVMAQDSPSKVRVFAKRGGYEVDMASDRDGELISALGVSSLPANYFVDRRGVISQVKSGIITKEEIIDALLD
ncbi:MAG: Fibronectin type III domain protein [Candidatus Woesebacteria bacterium GW2011_GWB1_45_5]|uniref:Fibronectin type III domain protein n=1 Tax=Candidatus Woesebacteria bacterium GW2011_GWB1_45_5 TaxID=1618581 RepID=A0A0G1MQ81_9BACT|nr:MAG: Fibronectin type III domain protein [Candidatus Woesebacteria bacterium GW2011_GWB1_45_5]